MMRQAEWKKSLTLTTLLAAWIGTWASTPAHAMLREIPALETRGRHLFESEEATELRIAHARELLGKHFDRSIVSLETGAADLQAFVKTQVSQALKGKDRRYSAAVSRTLFEESKKYDFDPIFLMAVIKSESGFKTKVRGGDGEIGLMQILPNTGRWIAKQSGIPWKGAKRTLEDPVLNIRIGAAYLSHLREQFNAHGRLYLTAYNMGATNVQRALHRDIWPKTYASRVMKRYVGFYHELVLSSFTY